MRKHERSLSKKNGILRKNSGHLPSAARRQARTSRSRLTTPISIFRMSNLNKMLSLGDTSLAETPLFRARTCSGQADFASATFFGWAYLGGAAFARGATFFRTTISGGAVFYGATFSDTATFGGATFSDTATFGRATFSGWAMFNGATFSGLAHFGNATFGLESNFVNAEMNGETSFEGAIFDKEPPRFFGAKLHQGTVWRGIDWPVPKKADEAGHPRRLRVPQARNGPAEKARGRTRFLRPRIAIAPRVCLAPGEACQFGFTGFFRTTAAAMFGRSCALLVVAAIGARATRIFRRAPHRRILWPQRREHPQCIRLPQGFF